jgi:hypothetical protein
VRPVQESPRTQHEEERLTLQISEWFFWNHPLLKELAEYAMDRLPPMILLQQMQPRKSLFKQLKPLSITDVREP